MQRTTKPHVVSTKKPKQTLPEKNVDSVEVENREYMESSIDTDKRTDSVIASPNGEENDYTTTDYPLPPTAQPIPSIAASLATTRQDITQWLRARTPEQWVYTSIFALAAVLRFWDLSYKALHHDESLHAYYSLQFLLNPAGYHYDPLLHGPFQFHIIPFFYLLGQLFGVPGNGANDVTARLLPACMGLAMVAMPYWLRDQLGRWGALSMSLILAVSPSFVYFSRFVRDDIYVTCFTLLIVVAAVQYAKTRRLAWLITGVAALVLAYTAMENTFFIIAVFGSYLVALVLWDLGPTIGNFLKNNFAKQDLPLVGRTTLLVPFGIVMGIAGLFGLRSLGMLSTTINNLATTHTGATDPLNPDVTIQHYESIAVLILLVVSIAVALSVIVALLRQSSSEYVPATKRASWIDPRTQPVLDTLANTDWLRWFIVFVVAWVLFATFFWTIPSDLTSLSQWGQGFNTGIGRGLLQGLYYWLEQQHVARGGQPWYYYFILLPMYEQLALVFGLAGLVRCLVQPNRFRLFLVYWFLTNVALYSWAGEKMPWLIVHMLLPLIALSGVSLDWVVGTLVRGAANWWQPTRILVGSGLFASIVAIASVSVATTVGMTLFFSVAAIAAIGVAAGIEWWVRRQAMRTAVIQDLNHLPSQPGWIAGMQQIVAVSCAIVALTLLIPTVWNMQRLTFVDPDNAPKEMLIYTQTTPAVTATMAKVAKLDQVLTGGKKTLSIGVTQEATWPFVWYLHEYANVQYSYTAVANGPRPDVIISDASGGSNNVNLIAPDMYTSKQYPMRWWWDESYKLPACSTTKTTQCTTTASWDSGDGPFQWISYGAFPPAQCTTLSNPACDRLNTPANGVKAAQRYWDWLWKRQNISGTQPGSTDFVFFVKNADTKMITP